MINMQNNFNRLVVGLTFVCAIIALSLTITNHQIETALSNYDKMNQEEQVIVLDIPRLVSGFSKAGASQEEALQAVNGLLMGFEDNGYIVLDARNILAAPSSKQFSTEDYQQLIDFAQSKGYDVNEGVDESIRAVSEITDLMRQMNNH